MNYFFSRDGGKVGQTNLKLVGKHHLLTMCAVVHKPLLIHMHQHICGISFGPLWRFEMLFCLTVDTFACAPLFRASCLIKYGSFMKDDIPSEVNHKINKEQKVSFSGYVANIFLNVWCVSALPSVVIIRNWLMMLSIFGTGLHQILLHLEWSESWSWCQQVTRSLCSYWTPHCPTTCWQHVLTPSHHQTGSWSSTSLSPCLWGQQVSLSKSSWLFMIKAPGLDGAVKS